MKVQKKTLSIPRNLCFLAVACSTLQLPLSLQSLPEGLVTFYVVVPEIFSESGILIFGRATIYKFNNTYAIRMAGMFIFVLGIIWVRTGLMPRWLAIMTCLTALTLIIGVAFWPWSFSLWSPW